MEQGKYLNCRPSNLRFERKKKTAPVERAAWDIKR